MKEKIDFFFCKEIIFGIVTQLKTTTSSSNQRKRLHKQAALDVGDRLLLQTV